MAATAGWQPPLGGTRRSMRGNANAHHYSYQPTVLRAHRTHDPFTSVTCGTGYCVGLFACGL